MCGPCCTLCIPEFQHTQEVVDYVLYYGSMMRKAMQKVIDSPLGDGLYFPACLKHESKTIRVECRIAWSGIKVIQMSGMESRLV